MYRNSDNWILHCDVYVTAFGFDVYVEIPGVGSDDFELEITPRVVKIWGVKKKLCHRATALAIEIQTGEFQRELYLPSRVDTENVSAELKLGVLHIKLVKEKAVSVVVSVQDKGNNNL